MSRVFKKRAVLVVFVILLVLAPAARAGVADIITLLNTITSTIKNGIGVALNGIQTIQTAEKQLQQQVLWPVSVLNQAKSSVAQVRSQYANLAQQVHNLDTASATLANPKQLELLLRGRQTGSIPQISGSFLSLYQPLPPASDASPRTRNLMDVDDAFATGALKASVISDQASERMLGVADSLEQQTAAAAPGTAPMLSAQALAANLQSQAFLQRMLAAELRQEAVKMAHQAILVKESSSAASDLNRSLRQVLTK